MVWLLLSAAAVVIVYLSYRVSRQRKDNKRLACRLIELEEMKKNFISHVSHELKAPLASMQETTHLLLEKIPGPLTEKQKRMLDLNLQSGKRLAQMIGNLLDLTRLEAGIVEYDMQPSDISDLIHKVVLELAPQINQKSLELVTDIQPEPLMVQCDPNRMVQLFTNLLENAIRFSNKGGSIAVHARTVRDHPRLPQPLRRSLRADAPAEYALVGVSDTGPGIQDSNKTKIFHTFHQAKQGRKSHGESLGLGLAISQAVVEAHDGTIWVEDNPGGGAMFYVLLPRVSEQTGTLAEAS